MLKLVHKIERGDDMENPVMTLQKNVERNTNKIRIPKAIIESFGKKFYMKIYSDKIVLIPVNKK